MVIDLFELPDCETCADPTKEKSGIIFDVPEPGAITITYTCKNVNCKRKWDAVGCSILLRERAELDIALGGAYEKIE